jgi:hypothetical protein
LLEKADETALGSDVMSAALEGYALLKVSGKGAGLDALRHGMSARFTRQGQDQGPARRRLATHAIEPLAGADSLGSEAQSSRRKAFCLVRKAPSLAGKPRNLARLFASPAKMRCSAAAAPGFAASRRWHYYSVNTSRLQGRATLQGR